MKSINKINGYIHGFDNQNLFEGRLLLDDEGWVEGIINPLDKEEEKKLIFGFFYHEKVIELFELSPINNYSTLNFHVEKSSNYYTGEILIMNESNQHLYGLCSIIIQNQELNSENTFCEIERLEYEIEELKKNMDLYGETFYNAVIQNKDRIKRVVVDSYNVNAKIKRLSKKN